MSINIIVWDKCSLYCKWVLNNHYAFSLGLRHISFGVSVHSTAHDILITSWWNFYKLFIHCWFLALNKNQQWSDSLASDQRRILFITYWSIFKWPKFTEQEMKGNLSLFLSPPSLSVSNCPYLPTLPLPSIPPPVLLFLPYVSISVFTVSFSGDLSQLPLYSPLTPFYLSRILTSVEGSDRGTAWG